MSIKRMIMLVLFNDIYIFFFHYDSLPFGIATCTVSSEVALYRIRNDYHHSDYVPL